MRRQQAIQAEVPPLTLGERGSLVESRICQQLISALGDHFWLPIKRIPPAKLGCSVQIGCPAFAIRAVARSEEHTSELQSLMRISYAVFCLKKKNNTKSIR